MWYTAYVMSAKDMKREENHMQISEFLQNMCIADINFVKTYIASSGSYPMHNRGRGHHGFLYTLEGTETYHFQDRKLDAVPNSVLYIPKGEEYKTTLDDEKSVVAVVDFELYGEYARPFIIPIPDPGSMKIWFSKMETTWNRKDMPYMPECKSLCYRIICAMAQQTAMFCPSQKYDKITDAVKYLHQHYLESDFRLEDLASIAGISQRYFETLFHQKYGTTPKEYVISLKIEQAKELLMSEKLLVRDIAFLLGYSDIYHFGKIFTKKTGFTPSQYRTHFL